MMRCVVAFVALVALLTGCSAALERPVMRMPFADGSNAGMGRMDTIKKVVDGDTVVLASEDTKVRILGIDTPETVHPSKPVECWGPEASAWAKQQLPVGKRVRIEFDPHTDDKSRMDRYDRLLGYVMYQNAGDTAWRDFSVESARAGMARNYVYDEPVSRQDKIAAAEQEAKKAHRGLWNPQNCRG